MASSRGFKECIAANSSNPDRLPESVHQASNQNLKGPMITALKNHVVTLEQAKENIEATHSKKLENLLEDSTPGHYVNRGGDPTNELGTFRADMKKLVRNIVQQAKSITAALKHPFANDLTPDERDLINRFNKGFNPKFTAALEKIFQAKKGKAFHHRAEDPFQFFPERTKADFEMSVLDIVPHIYETEDGTRVESILDTPLKEAISATAYEWIAGDGVRKAMSQTTQGLRQLLQLDKNESPSSETWAHLKYAGVHRDSLAASLGATILKRLSIQDTPQSDAMAKKRLEMSLGFMAIAAMEELGIVEREQLHTGLGTNERHVGLEALKNGATDLDTDQVWFDALTDKVYEGMSTMKLVRLNSQVDSNGNLILDDNNFPVPLEWVTSAKEALDKAPGAFDTLFNNDSNRQEISFKKIVLKGLKIGRSKQKPAKTQMDNLQKYTDIPYTASETTLGPWKAMYELAQGNEEAMEFFRQIMGNESMDGRLTIMKDSVDGVNRGIQDDIDAVMDFLKLSEESGNKTFYIPNNFQNNHRMRQNGLINPQNSKIHRNLFAPQGWAVSFKPGQDAFLDSEFKQAVALAFDIENGKVGGVDEQLRLLDEALQDPVVAQAITALRGYDGQMTVEIMRAVAPAVEQLETKLHAFKGLIEYARYLDYTDPKVKTTGEFTTDLYKEIDGVSNGPIIGMFQLIPDLGNKQALLATLAMGGISIDPKDVNLDELIHDPELNDAYQRMGQVWALELAKLKQELDKTTTKGQDNKQLFEQAQAIGAILGEFQDDKGVINKIVRNLSKPRTMQTIYGAGIRRQSNILAGSDVIGKLYKDVEAIMAKMETTSVNDVELFNELQTLLNHVAVLTDNSAIDANTYINNGTWDIQKLSEFGLTKPEIDSLTKAVRATYGEAMSRAIDTVYGPAIAARTPLLNSVQMAITIYNTTLKTRVDAVLATKKANEQKEIITNEELNEILKDLEPMVPKIRTPMGSFIQLATVGKTKQYMEQAEVKQSYATDLTLQKGIAEGIPFLDPAGAAPMVIAIQAIDASIANDLMGIDEHILNNHDGFSHGINASDAVRERANQRFYDIMATYSLGTEFSNMHTSVLAISETLMEDAGVDQIQLFDNLLNEGVINVDVTAAVLKRDPEEIRNFISDRFNAYKEHDDYRSFKTVETEVLEGIWAKRDKAVMLEQVLEELTDQTVSMGKQTTKNKNVVVAAMTESAQYPDKGKGVKVTPTSTESTVFGEDVDKVVSIDKENTDTVIQELRELIQNEAYRSSQEDVSTDSQDYPDPTKVDSKTVRQIFNDLVKMDKAALFGSIPLTRTHQTHLERVMDNIVSKVMKPVELYMAERDTETSGIAEIDDENGNRIYIQTQKVSTHPKSGMLGHGIRMSAAEVLAHELVHHTTVGAFEKNPGVYRQAYTLMEFAKEQFQRPTSQGGFGVEAWRVFLNDPYATNPDPYDVQAAQARWDHLFENKADITGRNQSVAEFLAFGLTNENFKSQLSTLQADDKLLGRRKRLKEMWAGNIQDTIANLFNRIMELITETMVRQKHSTRVDQEVENLVLALGMIDSRAKNTVYAATVEAENRATAMVVDLDEKAKAKVNKSWSSTKIGNTIAKVKKLPELDNMLSHKMRLVMGWYNDKEAGLIPSIVTEMQGSTERMKPLHQLLQRRNRVLDNAKLEAATKVRDSVLSWFPDQDLTPHTKEAVTKVLLKGDISSLLGVTTHTALQGYIEDAGKREAKIRDIIAQIDNNAALQPYRTFFENAADDLAFFMIHGSIRDDQGVPMMNAHNIALMKGTQGENKVRGKDLVEAKKHIDMLASLMAMRYVKSDHRQAVVNLMNQNFTGVESVLQHHNLLKEQAKADLFGNNPALMIKGYTNQILNPRIQYEQATIDRREELEAAGYIMQKTPIERDPKDPVQDKIYMFKSALGTINDYQSGILSITRNSKKGKTAYHIQKQIGNNTAPGIVAQQNNTRMLIETRTRLNNMFNQRNPAGTVPRSGNFMVPKFDLNGNITELRYMMTERTKDQVLEQFSEFDSVLGAMSSQIVDKVNTPDINTDLIYALRELYDHKDYGFVKVPEAFVEISPYTDIERYRDIYYMMPDATKEQIKSLFGEDRLMVPRDIVDLAFGQRKYSIVEMFGKDPKTMKMFERTTHMVLNFALGVKNPFVQEDFSNETTARKNRAVNRAKKVEDFATQLTSLAKSNIVVRNLRVSHGNYMSNMAYLKSKGIPLEQIMKHSRKAIVSSLEYQRVNKALNVLESQRDIINRKTTISQAVKDQRLKEMDKRIRRLQDELARNPSTDMIRAGLMPQIVDDVDTSHIQSPYKFGLDKGIDTALGYLPGEKLEKLGRTLFMTEDTEGFTMLNNAVKMTDYVGRYVLYQHYTEKMGMSHNDALTAVMDEFINFDLPTHRMLEYANNIGLVWFSKYQLRVLKHIKNLVKDRPFSTLATFILGSFLIGGNNIIQSVPGVTKDLLQPFSTPFDAFLGTPGDIMYVDGVQGLGGIVGVGTGM